MSRFTNKATGVTVSVADRKDGRFGEEWESTDAKPKPAPRKPSGSRRA